MINLSKVKSTEVTGDGDREVKVVEYGVKTGTEVSAFGDDGNPLENMSAVYAETGEVGEPVVVGYINTNQLASPGEKRIYSLTPSGDVSTFIWLRSDGSIELGGTGDHLVRYTPLSAGLNGLVNSINAELTKIQTAITGLGGTYARLNVSVDIATAQVSEIDVTTL